MESRKRKPLSDITNKFNLTPTPVLRKLVAASSTSNLCSKPPISISKSNSSSTNLKLFSESSSRSNTSIGSSNVGATLSSKKTVQFQSPRPSISPGKEKEIDNGITGKSPCSVENTNGREGILKHSRSSTVKGQEGRNSLGFFVDSAKEKGQPSNTSHEKTSEKGKATLPSYDVVEIIESAKEKGKPLTFNSLHEKTREKGKAILQPSDMDQIMESAKDKAKPTVPFSSSHEKTREKGKVTLQHSGIIEIIDRAKEKGKPLKTFNSLHEKTREKGKAIIRPSDMDQITESAKDKAKSLNTFSSSREKTREKGRVVLQSSNSAEIIESSEDKGKPCNTFNSLHEKTKEKGKENQHSNIVEVAEPKGSSDAVKVLKSRPPRRISQKMNFDAGASSCPPVMRPKSIQNDLGEFGDVKSVKPWSDLRPKRRKRTCTRTENTCALPLEFIEQQKAYFKEVDDFELLEEEAAPDELD